MEECFGFLDIIVFERQLNTFGIKLIIDQQTCQIFYINLLFKVGHFVSRKEPKLIINVDVHWCSVFAESQSLHKVRRKHFGLLMITLDVCVFVCVNMENSPQIKIQIF